MQSEATPPLRPGAVFGWGLAMFLAVLVGVGLLTGYFWKQRDALVVQQVGERSTFGDLKTATEAAAAARLNGYKKLGEGRYQIPVDIAMKKVVEEGL